MGEDEDEDEVLGAGLRMHACMCLGGLAEWVLVVVVMG